MSSYERTGHRLSLPKRLSSEGTGDDAPGVAEQVITRHDILDDGSAFLLQDFLTKHECDDLIRQAEDLGLSPCGYSARRTNRVAADSAELSNALFDRIKPFVGPIDLESATGPDSYPRGVPRSMEPHKWRPVSLNPTFRICRYDEGGFFLPHHDGGFRRDRHCQSMQTLMVYLNEDFEGGRTNFYDQAQRHYSEPNPENCVYSYQPRTGDALVFNSQITHDGGYLTSGHKYILRSEVMYQAAPEEAVAEPDHSADADLSWP